MGYPEADWAHQVIKHLGSGGVLPATTSRLSQSKSKRPPHSHGGKIPFSKAGKGGQESGRPSPNFQAEEVRHFVRLAEYFGNCSEIGGSAGKMTV